MNLSTFEDIVKPENQLYRDWNLDDGKNWGRGATKRLGSGLFGRAASQIGFGNSLEGQRQSGLSGMLSALNPSNLSALLSSFGRQAQATAADQARQSELALRSAGLGNGAVAGARLAAANKAATDTNARMAQLLSPAGLESLFGSYLKALAMAQESPALGNIQSIVSGQPASVSSGDGWSQFLGPALQLLSLYKPLPKTPTPQTKDSG